MLLQPPPGGPMPLGGGIARPSLARVVLTARADLGQ